MELTSAPAPSIQYRGTQNLNHWTTREVPGHFLCSLCLECFPVVNRTGPSPPSYLEYPFKKCVYFLTSPLDLRNLSSLSRVGIHAPAVESWILNHWTTREVPTMLLFSSLFSSWCLSCREISQTYLFTHFLSVSPTLTCWLHVGHEPGL